MNLRDKTLPLASLRSLFSMPDAPITEQCRIVVLAMGAASIGIVVDEVREVLSVHESVIDLNRRFELPQQERDDHQRIMVFALNGVTVGFIVDAVSEVLKIPKSFISEAPSLSEDQARIFKRLANLQKDRQSRIIQIIEPRELLEAHEINELQSSREQGQ
jgi:purine-binding chemotaxis protein CheW